MSRDGTLVGDQEWEQFGSSQLKKVKDSREDDRPILKMNEDGIRYAESPEQALWLGC